MIGRSFCGKSAGLKMDMGACLGTGALFMRRASVVSSVFKAVGHREGLTPKDGHSAKWGFLADFAFPFLPRVFRC